MLLREHLASNAAAVGSKGTIAADASASATTRDKGNKKIQKKATTQIEVEVALPWWRRGVDSNSGSSGPSSSGHESVSIREEPIRVVEAGNDDECEGASVPGASYIRDILHCGCSTDRNGDEDGEKGEGVGNEDEEETDASTTSLSYLDVIANQPHRALLLVTPDVVPVEDWSG
jgi:hypothetical protein